MKILGFVISGTKKGGYFISQKFYNEQFEEKLGFKHCILPQNNCKNMKFSREGFSLHAVSSVSQMLHAAIGEGKE